MPENFQSAVEETIHYVKDALIFSLSQGSIHPLKSANGLNIHSLNGHKALRNNCQYLFLLGAGPDLQLESDGDNNVGITRIGWSYDNKVMSQGRATTMLPDYFLTG